MTTYTAITSGQVDQDSPINQALATAWRDNVLAIAETDATAPLAAFAWQIEDGAGGTDPIWDHSVDGTVAEIETPVFEAGWEYALVGEGVSINDTGNLDLLGYRTAASNYSGPVSVATYDSGGTASHSFFIHLVFPMWSRQMHFTHIISAEHPSSGSAGTAVPSDGFFYEPLGTTISKVKLDTSGGAANIDAGKVYLLKRAEYGGR